MRAHLICRMGFSPCGLSTASVHRQHGLKPILLCLLISVASPVYAAPDARPWLGVHVGMSSDRQVAGLTEVVGQLADLGINVIITEINYGFEYQSHPELRSPNPCTKEQIGKLVAECKKHHVRLIPQFQCLGHQSWSRNTVPLLTKYPQFDETPGLYPENKDIYCRSWCPLHPEVNPIVFSLMDELIDAFQADALHVGMDEVFLLGEDACPRCKGKDKGRAFRQGGQRLSQAPRGRKARRDANVGRPPDRLPQAHSSASGKAARTARAGAIDLVPRTSSSVTGTTSCGRPTSRSRMFLEKGFRVWPASWRKPYAAKAFVDYSLTQQNNPRMLGHLNTTWGAVPIRDLPKFEPLLVATRSFRQEFVPMHDPADRGQPGDEMIQEYLKRQALRIDGTFPLDYVSPEHWKGLRDRYKQEYFYMLGLSPMPEKIPAEDHDHWNVPGRWLCGRPAPLPEHAPSIRHGQSLSAAARRARAAFAGRALRLRALQLRPQRQQDRLSIARDLVRPARVHLLGPRLPCNWARSRGFITAPIARAAGGGIPAATRRRASSASTGCAASTT